MTYNLINLREVRRRLPRSRSTIYAEIDRRVFPRPIKVGRGSYWRDDEIESLITAYSEGADAATLQRLCCTFYQRRLGR